MAKYRGYVCTFLDFEADSEDDTTDKAVAELLRRIRNDELGISIWEASPDAAHSPSKEG